jgi:hypothetical protein
MNNPLPYLTRQMLCKRLNISISSIKRYEKKYLLTRSEVGPRLIRYNPDDVAAFLARTNKADTKSTPTVTEQDASKAPNLKRKMTAKDEFSPDL